MTPDRLQRLADEMGDITAADFRAGANDDSDDADLPHRRGVVFIPIRGYLMHRKNFISEYFGLTTIEELGKQFRKAMKSRDVSDIVFVADSAGGTTTGIEELADEVFRARSEKRIQTFVDGATLSCAAYWLCSAASEIVVTPSATEIGGMGCLMVHRSSSDTDVRILRSSGASNKARFNPYETLTDETIKAAVSRLDQIEERFEADVARFRGTTREKIRQRFGNGSAFGSRQAFERGLIDRMQPWVGFLNTIGLQQDLSKVKYEFLPVRSGN